MKRLLLLLPLLMSSQSTAGENEFKSTLPEQCSQNNFHCRHKIIEDNYRCHERESIYSIKLYDRTSFSAGQNPSLKTHEKLINRVLTHNGEISGAIKQSGEKDCFLIDQSSGKIIVISLSSGSSLYPILEVFNADGAIVSKPHMHNSSLFKMQMLKLNGSNTPLKLRIKAQNARTGDYKLKYIFASIPSLKDDVIRLTNVKRRQRRLSDLSYDPHLEAAAQLHADDMKISGRYLSHTGSNGSSPGDRIRLAGYKAAWHENGDGSRMYIRQENVASGQLSPASVVEGWMNSPSHRAAMLSPEAEEIGIGFEVDTKTGASYWVQTFGIPWTVGDKLFL